MNEDRVTAIVNRIMMCQYPEPAPLSQSNIARLEAMFADSKVGRVLVEYYTDPKPGEEWAIPDIAAILGPSKLSGVYPSHPWSPETS